MKEVVCFRGSNCNEDFKIIGKKIVPNLDKYGHGSLKGELLSVER